MSIATEITRLENAKSDISSSIEAKGVAVPEGTTLDEMPALIDKIGMLDVTPDRVLVSDSDGRKPVASEVTSTELNYLSGVTSNVQDQLDGKAEANHTHGASSGLRGYTTSDFATAAKVVTLYGVTTLTLEAGMIFMVDFAGSGDNMMSNVTLNINGTGAYPIMVGDSTFTGHDSKYTGKWSATITYMFNGTHYVWLNTDYGAASANRIVGGTFGGQVAANSSRQTPGVSCLRNSKLVSSADANIPLVNTAPTVNGEIFWAYK